VLLQAAQKAFISNIQRRLPSKNFVLWIDPGCVSVKFQNQNIETIYEEPQYNIYNEFKKLNSYPISTLNQTCRNEHHRKNLRNVDSANHVNHDTMPV
jgi:hypothetical protein